MRWPSATQWNPPKPPTIFHPTTTVPQLPPPYLDAAIFLSPNSAFTLTSRSRFPLISLPLHSGEAKQRWESFCSVVFQVLQYWLFFFFWRLFTAWFILRSRHDTKLCIYDILLYSYNYLIAFIQKGKNYFISLVVPFPALNPISNSYFGSVKSV
jgi:hypothetical protein